MGVIQDILTKFGDETVSIIRANLSDTGTNASGETSQSLQSKQDKNKVTVTGKPFIYVVETGRKAGKRPPISNIMKWLDSGKVNFSGSKVSMAWAISTKIGQEGSALFRKGGRKDIITPAISEARVNKLTADVANASMDFIVSKIDGKGR